MLHVIVASDLQIVRESLVRALNQFSDLCATSCLALASTVNAELRRKTVNAVLWVTNGRLRGDDTQLQQLRSAPRTLVLRLETGVTGKEHPEELAGSFVLAADISVEELRAAVYRQAGPLPSVASPVIRHAQEALADVACLTPREREVLGLMANGLSNKEIAASLELSVFTAKNHVQRLLTKLELHSRSAVIAKYGHALNPAGKSRA